jgi:hypothetical protein
MRKYAAIVAAAALVASTGIASAQSRNYDSSGAPKSAPSSPRSGGGLATGGMTGSGETTGKSNPNPQSGAGDRQPAPPSSNIGDSSAPNANPR